MTSIRIAIASVLAAAAMFTGAAIAHHDARPAGYSQRTVVASPVLCCDECDGEDLTASLTH